MIKITNKSKIHHSINNIFINRKLLDIKSEESVTVFKNELQNDWQIKMKGFSNLIIDLEPAREVLEVPVQISEKSPTKELKELPKEPIIKPLLDNEKLLETKVKEDSNKKKE